MKKLLFTVAIATLFLGACKKDQQKEQPKTNSQLIIGRWDVVKMHYASYENNVKVEEDDGYDPIKISFTKSDYLVSYGFADTLDYGPYTLTKDSLFMNGDDGGHFAILKFNEKDLHLFFAVEEQIDTTLYRNETTIYLKKS